ncbi:hypothetical protein EON63_07210 [archaeon]|nr:MAG: hypothetical protein EON63_07210 [archaeon]
MYIWLYQVWDVRMLKSLHTYTLKHPAQSLAISDTGLIAVGMGRTVEILQHAFTTPHSSLTYLSHTLSPPPRQYVHGVSSGVSSKMSLASSMSIQQLAFRPLEDVLAIGHSHGVQSLVVPGAGEANFDSYESNPFLDSKQRREGEVQSLLNKLQPEMIGLGKEGAMGLCIFDFMCMVWL